MNVSNKFYIAAAAIAIIGTADYLVYRSRTLPSAPSTDTEAVTSTTEKPKPCLGLGTITIGYHDFPPMLIGDGKSQPTGFVVEVLNERLHTEKCEVLWKLTKDGASDADLIIGTPNEVAHLIDQRWFPTKPYAIVALRMVKRPEVKLEEQGQLIWVDTRWIALIAERYPNAKITTASAADAVTEVVRKSDARVAIVPGSMDLTHINPNQEATSLDIPLIVAINPNLASQAGKLSDLVAMKLPDVEKTAGKYKLDGLKPPP